MVDRGQSDKDVYTYEERKGDHKEEIYHMFSRTRGLDPCRRFWGLCHPCYKAAPRSPSRRGSVSPCLLRTDMVDRVLDDKVVDRGGYHMTR